MNAYRYISLLAINFLPSICLARYTEEFHESNDGSWMYAYIFLLAVGVKHIHIEMKKGAVAGWKAVAIVSSLGVAAYIFPIINGVLVALAAIAFAYGMFSNGRR